MALSDSTGVLRFTHDDLDQAMRAFVKDPQSLPDTLRRWRDDGILDQLADIAYRSWGRTNWAGYVDWDSPPGEEEHVC